MATVTVLTWKSNAWWGLLCTIYLCIVYPICHTIYPCKTNRRPVYLCIILKTILAPLSANTRLLEASKGCRIRQSVVRVHLWTNNSELKVFTVQSPTRFEERNIFNVFERWSHPDSACSEAVADIDCLSNILSGLISSFQFPNILQN